MRTVWFLAGGAAGVYTTAKVRRVAEAFSYDGVHDRLTGWFAGARVVRDELRAGISEKTTELRERLAVEGAIEGAVEGAGDTGTVLALPTGAPGPDTHQSSTDASRKRDH